MKNNSLIRMVTATMVVWVIGLSIACGQGEDPREPRLWRAISGQSLKAALKAAEIKGPVFGARRLSLAPGHSRSAEMSFCFRSLGPLYSGYEMRLVKKDNASRDETERITLKIE